MGRPRKSIEESEADEAGVDRGLYEEAMECKENYQEALELLEKIGNDPDMTTSQNSRVKNLAEAARAFCKRAKE